MPNFLRLSQKVTHSWPEKFHFPEPSTDIEREAMRFLSMRSSGRLGRGFRSSIPYRKYLSDIAEMSGGARILTAKATGNYDQWRTGGVHID
jgi:hypothetical protein